LSGFPQAVGGLLFGVLMDYLLMGLYKRKVRKLLMKGATYVDTAKIEEFLGECIQELRKPLPKALSRTILSRIVDLPLDEEKLVYHLKKLADSGEFFVKTDDIAEAIDRVDLRRRQKAFEPVGIPVELAV